jgi:hypothetical protein
MVLNCDLEGCDNQFEVKIYPRQYVYPKYCPEHRNEYRRIRHLSRIGRSDLIELIKKEGECVDLQTLMNQSDMNDESSDIAEIVA